MAGSGSSSQRPPPQELSSLSSQNQREIKRPEQRGPCLPWERLSCQRLRCPGAQTWQQGATGHNLPAAGLGKGWHAAGHGHSGQGWHREVNPAVGHGSTGRAWPRARRGELPPRAAQQQVPLGSTLLLSHLSDQWRNSDSNRRLCATGIPSGKKCRALTHFPLMEGPGVRSEAHTGSQNPAPDAIQRCRLAQERCWDASQPLPAWVPAAQASLAPAWEAPRWELLAAERAGVLGRALQGCLPARLTPALARTRAGRQKRRAQKNDELKAMETERRRHPVRAAARP